MAAVLIKSQVMATNVDSLNRSAIASVDLENGNLVELGAISSEPEVFTASFPSVNTGLYMVAEPEVVITMAGMKKYKGLDPDPRSFSIAAETPFTVFKLQVGDIITITSEGTVGVAADYLIADSTALARQKLQFSAVAGTGLTLKVIETTYISIGNQRVTAYRAEVVAI